MQKKNTRICFLACPADITSFASAISEQYPEVTCDFREGTGEAVDYVKTTAADLIIFHWKGRGARGAFGAMTDALRAGGRKTPVIVVTDSASPEVALHVLKAGAVDCIRHPSGVSRLVFLVGTLTTRADRESSEPVAAANPCGEVPVFPQSAMMQNMMDHLRLAARSESTILLTGETGTGKNRMATYIHQMSSRRHEPLVTVDCGASSESLIESELFGHVRGAFTGADQNHVGKLERVGRGTVLLDEIDCLPMRCQSRLLRVLEERVFERVGDDHTRSFQGRVIALTNSSLLQDVAEKRFRKDLYYRVNVLAFKVPPLRERNEDVATLAQYFLQRLSSHRSGKIEFSEEALAAMSRYDWPGNIRELRNSVECAIALSTNGRIEPQHLNLPSTAFDSPVSSCEEDDNPLASARSEGERRVLVRVLEEAENNRTRAARRLGISRSAFYKRLDKVGLS